MFLALLVTFTSAGFVILTNDTFVDFVAQYKCDECVMPFNETIQFDSKPTLCTNETSEINIKLLESIPRDITMAIYELTLNYSHTLDDYGLPTYLQVNMGSSEPVRFFLNPDYANDICADCVYTEKFICSPTYGQVGTIITLKPLGNIICFSGIKITQFLSIETPDIISVSPPLGPINGNTVIAITGSNFFDDQFECYFNATQGEFIRISEQKAQCISPPYEHADSVVVKLYSKRYPTRDLAHFSYQYYNTIFSSARMYQDESGKNQQIEVCGSGVVSSENIECVISSNGMNTTVGGIYLNEDCVLCLYDPTKSGDKVTITVYLNGQDSSGSISLEWKTDFQYGKVTLLVFVGVVALFLIIGVVVLGVQIFRRGKGKSFRGGITASDVFLKERISTLEHQTVWHGNWKGVELAVKKVLISEGDVCMKEEVVKRMMSSRHPCTVQYLGFWYEDNRLCVAMEYFSKKSLFDVLHSSLKGVTIATKLRMLGDASKGLEFLHSCSPVLVHGNLTSRNLMVSQNYSIKIGDFGMRKCGEEVKCKDVPWSAPEVLQFGDISTKSDIYSFAIIMWEVVMTKIPFGETDNVEDIRKMIISGVRPKLGKEIPQCCQDLLLSCWVSQQDRVIQIDEIALRVESWKHTQIWFL
ncbi:serine-threonine protein kinase, putative [Entamoeba invadens IP1]|uniref:serine-threonine protein kinase, putative n=1 Tax=Entamoeba invadens IP1 TaxID=370355 RepID=UPI0002C3DEA0|nr:serine-threonine protein kinase, putative [Entamoeba invadens IP1]ELP90392.1 serine-threonine protein kinase, putative [Entamoeba invadens IP1]|eukprot:XP_004257163.1 serine-threonine protein kinase, putative [Entamoeba invadens IP1]